MRRNHEKGFSLIELLVVFAVIGVLALVATPNIRSWSRSYQVKNAAMDLYSVMQMAKSGAVKKNRAWTLVINPDGGGSYQVKDGTEAVVKNVQLSQDYSNQVELKEPESPFAPYRFSNNGNQLTFAPSGLTPVTGSVFFADTKNKQYYRVGARFISGAVRVEKWNESTRAWE